MKVIAMNLVNGGVTEYADFPFVSFAAVGDKLFAAGPDGLFELTGKTDDGKPIGALAKFGKLDFGDSHLKRATAAYVEARSEGDLAFHVYAEDGNDYEYPISFQNPALETRRTLIGRGIRTRRWQFGISNPDGADFVVSSVSVPVTATSRRI